MRLSTREIVLAWITGIILLYAGSYVVCKPQIDTLAERRKQGHEIEARIRKAENLLSQRTAWEERLNELRKTVRPLPAGQTAASYMKRTIGDLASRNNVQVKDLRDGEEKKHGGLHVLPIICPWDADTEGIVKLLFDFQSNDVIFDVRELLIRSSGKDQLKGNFTVSCIYTKQEDK